jgi:multicomponent Na+:H+ antiporter subunit G
VIDAQLVLKLISDLLVINSLIIMSLAVYGMTWMPDLYTRLHAASKSAFLGIVPLLIVICLPGDPAFISRSILIGLFLLLTTPVSAHVIAQAAYRRRRPMQTPGATDESGRVLPGKIETLDETHDSGTIIN